MTAELPAIAALCLVVAGQAYWINTLLNKLMSRNYHEYQVAQAVPETMRPLPGLVEKFDDSPAEDLNHVGSPF